MREDSETAGVMTTITVPRRIVANLCGNDALPWRGSSPPGGARPWGIGSDDADAACRTHAGGMIGLTRCHSDRSRGV